MKRRKWTRDKLNALRELLEEEKTYPEISKEMGITESNLRYVIHTYKLRRNQPKIKKNRREFDIATRIRILKGEENRSDKPHFGFSDDQIKKWLKGVKGFSAFCKDILDVKLQSYQKEMAEKMLSSKRCCFVAGRQIGKDFTISCFVTWICICNSNQKVLLVSPAQRQSDLLYERILRFIGQRKELFESVQKSNMEQCKFTNTSVIKSLPSTTYIRGETGVTLCVMNEARDFVSGEETMASVLPMLATSKGSLVIMSSPAGCSGILWDTFNNPLFATLQYPSSVNKYIAKEWIDEQKQTLSTNYYQMEFEAQFSEAVDNFFSISTIEKCSKEYDFTNFPEEGKKYYCGVDWGRIKDSSVITIISKTEDECKIENIIELVNKPFSEQLAHIEMLHERYRFTRVIAEKAGLSLPLCEELMRKDMPFDEFVPTLDNKSEAFNHMLSELENGNIIIPKKHRKLQYELKTFRFEVTAQGKMKLHHASGGSDDFVDSACFAIWGVRRGRSGIIILEDPENIMGLF